MDEGETAAQAAVRELKEETGDPTPPHSCVMTLAALQPFVYWLRSCSRGRQLPCSCMQTVGCASLLRLLCRCQRTQGRSCATGYVGSVSEVSPVCYSDPGMTNANMQFAVVEVDADSPENVDVNPELEVGAPKISLCQCTSQSCAEIV